METIIEYLGVELSIKYSIDGKYIPATREYPEEFPEINILDILAGDVSIIDILLETQIEDIYILLQEKLEL